MKSKRSRSLTIIVVLLLGALVLPPLIFVLTRFEGEMPRLELEGNFQVIGASSVIQGSASDDKSGLKRVWIAVLQNGKERTLFDQSFPSKGFLRGGVVQSVPFSMEIKADEMDLVDGEALLRTAAWDFSYRGWFSGNQAYAEHKVVIDKKPPVIEVLSRAHNLNQGGSGLAVYRISEPCSRNGIQVGDSFFKGFAGFSSDPDLYAAFFALPHDQDPNAEILVTATDDAGNTGHGGLPYHVNAKRFRRDKIRISDGFLKRKLPEFSRFFDGNMGAASLIERFLFVNRDLRAANHQVVMAACEPSDAKLHWEGVFVRLPASARMAGFGDRRRYEYNGKVVDNQVHLGIDLASTALSAVPAANSGRVALTEYVGIYGNTVILDHGFGLFSMYSHLSRIDVEKGQEVSKGETIGHTGSTGLAGGDHLHYAMVVGQYYVNPIEWWDPNWIKHNVTSKLQEVSEGVKP
jgi:murein DD-endopeptidase MepM/ murein hydrolase activator NlpD